jgi:hypothetical protein
MTVTCSFTGPIRAMAGEAAGQCLMVVSEGGLEPIAYASVLSAEFALDADRPTGRIGA